MPAADSSATPSDLHMAKTFGVNARCGIENRNLEDQQSRRLVAVGGGVEARCRTGSHQLETQQSRQPLEEDVAAGYSFGTRAIQRHQASPVFADPRMVNKEDQAEDALRERIQMLSVDLRGAFRMLDRTDNGYVTTEDFLEAMERVFLPVGFDRDTLAAVARRFDLDRDGLISYHDFTTYMEKGDHGRQAPLVKERDLGRRERIGDADRAIQAFRQAVDRRHSSMREAFLSMRSGRKASLDRHDFEAGLEAYDIILGPGQLDLVYQRFDPAASGEVSYAQFCQIMSRSLQFGKHLDRQMFRDATDVASAPARAAMQAPRHGSAAGPPASVRDVGVKHGAGGAPLAGAALRAAVAGEAEEVLAAFAARDRKGSGCALRADIKLAVEGIFRRKGLTSEAVASIVSHLSLDSSGVISRTQLVDALGPIAPTPKNGTSNGEAKVIQASASRTLPAPQAAWEQTAAPASSAKDVRMNAVGKAEQVLREKIELNYLDLRAAFRAVDRTNNGYVSKSDFLDAMVHVFMPVGFSHADLASLSERFDLNNDGFISFSEFVAYIEGEDGDVDGVASAEPVHLVADLVSEVDHAALQFKESIDRRFSSLRVAFVSLTKSRRMWLEREDFYAALRSCDVRLGAEQMEAVRQRFDPELSGRVTFASFCRVMSQSLDFEKHLDRQMFR